MGMLIDGKWTKGSIVRSDKKGAYDRLPRTFRDFISVNHPVYKPESGRYHLYISYACPWATRTLIFRELKDLQDHITVDIVHPDMMDKGWTFQQRGEAKGDSLFESKLAHEIYTRADPDATTRVTVPILWDKKTNSIVSNESSENKPL